MAGDFFAQIKNKTCNFFKLDYAALGINPKSPSQTKNMQLQISAPSAPTLNQKIAITAIQKMLSSSFFSRCPLDNAAGLLNKKMSHETLARIETLHCINFDTMDKEILEFITDICNEIVE